MNINEFDQIWRHENEFFTMENSQEFWDSAASNFNHRVNDNNSTIHNTKADKLLDFLEQRNILNAETKVLDIGCGPGRYASEFAKRANHITAIDISSKMIQFAKQNTADEYLDRAYYETADWKVLDLSARGWQKKYDLVFASMTPGISSSNTLLKMCEASKGYCFMSGCIDRKDEVADQLYRAISGKEPMRRGKNLYYALNILFLSGYYPEIIYHDTEIEQVLTMEQAIKSYDMMLKMRKQTSPDMTNRLTSYLESIATNGLITEKWRAKVAWILWKV